MHVENITEEIQQQVNLGFTQAEIESNLLTKGYTNEDIQSALQNKNFRPVSAHGSVSTKSILIGIGFLILAGIRFGRYLSTGSVLAIILVITAILLALLHFSKRS